MDQGFALGQCAGLWRFAKVVLRALSQACGRADGFQWGNQGNAGPKMLGLCAGTQLIPVEIGAGQNHALAVVQCQDYIVTVLGFGTAASCLEIGAVLRAETVLGGRGFKGFYGHMTIAPKANHEQLLGAVLSKNKVCKEGGQ